MLGDASHLVVPLFSGIQSSHCLLGRKALFWYFMDFFFNVFCNFLSFTNLLHLTVC